MFNRFAPLSFAAFALLSITQIASAQFVVSPANLNPYSRTALGPYLNPQLRPYVVQDLEMDAFGPWQFRSGADRPNSYDEWIKQRESETRFSPSGLPIAYQIYSPYYDTNGTNTFIPTAVGRGRLGR